MDFKRICFFHLTYDRQAFGTGIKCIDRHFGMGIKCIDKHFGPGITFIDRHFDTSINE